MEETGKRKHEHTVRVGVSSRLLGQKVRYDAGHKHDPIINGILGRYFHFTPVCPEMEIGMGAPREKLRLQGEPEAPRMIGAEFGTDWTSRMNQFAEKRVQQPDIMNLCGFILKKGSPSCGLGRVKVLNKSGEVVGAGCGLFASSLIKNNPLLPVEEEDTLNDSKIRENFIERVIAYHRARF